MDGPVQHYAASGINRSFLVSLRELPGLQGTVADIRWNSGPLRSFRPNLANMEFNAAIAVTHQENIHFFSLEINTWKPAPSLSGRNMV